MSNPKFVIVVPTWSRADFLEELYKQVLGQGQHDWVLLFWNDCSPDNTVDVLESLSRRDDRVLFRSAVSNGGCNQSRNELLAWAKHDYPDRWMVMIDDDDVLLPGSLEVLSGLIAEAPSHDWFATTCETNTSSIKSVCRKPGTLNYIEDYMFGRVIQGDLLHCIRLSAIQDETFTNHFRSGEEWFFFCHLAKRLNMFLSTRNGALKNYQEGGLTDQGINRDKRKSVLELKLSSLKPIVGAKRLRHQYVSLASMCLREGDLLKARTLLDEVFKTSPYYFRQYRHRVKLFYKNLFSES